METSAALPAARLAAATAVPARGAITAERSIGKDVAHGSVLAIAWVLVLVLWVRVLRGTSPQVLLLAGTAVLACAIVSVAVTRLWIAHNVGIHRRKGPRTGVPTAPLDYAADWVGRGVTADWGDVRSAGIVVVCVSDARKLFLADPSVEAIDEGIGSPRDGAPEVLG